MFSVLANKIFAHNNEKVFWKCSKSLRVLMTKKVSVFLIMIGHFPRTQCLNMCAIARWGEIKLTAISLKVQNSLQPCNCTHLIFRCCSEFHCQIWNSAPGQGPFAVWPFWHSCVIVPQLWRDAITLQLLILTGTTHLPDSKGMKKKSLFLRI